MAYRVLLADDQRMTRMLLEPIIENAERYILVASLDTAHTAAADCRDNGIDLALLDVLFPDGSSGLDAARDIKAVSPRTKVILMTSMPEHSYLQRAREAGVDSFWYKEVQELPLLALMDRTMAGEHIYPLRAPELEIGNARSTEFTARELDVLRCIVEGLTNQEIAEQLSMSERTVKMHITHMLEKTGFKNRTLLAINARARGLVIPE